GPLDPGRTGELAPAKRARVAGAPRPARDPRPRLGFPQPGLPCDDALVAPLSLLQGPLQDPRRCPGRVPRRIRGTAMDERPLSAELADEPGSVRRGQEPRIRGEAWERDGANPAPVRLPRRIQNKPDQDGLHGAVARPGRSPRNSGVLACSPALRGLSADQERD